ncbi:MAG: hypothetical protein JRH19_26315, partial [Deltaproteobacteria bacterium]|nr:hypothetical protein [Deltaproteobacteria bacterium]
MGWSERVATPPGLARAGHPIIAAGAVLARTGAIDLGKPQATATFYQNSGPSEIRIQGRAHEHVAKGTHSFSVERGTVETRHSILHVEMDNEGQSEFEIRLGGPAVMISEGKILAAPRSADPVGAVVLDALSHTVGYRPDRAVAEIPLCRVRV